MSLFPVADADADADGDADEPRFNTPLPFFKQGGG